MNNLFVAKYLISTNELFPASCYIILKISPSSLETLSIKYGELLREVTLRPLMTPERVKNSHLYLWLHDARYKNKMSEWESQFVAFF
jgi:hypothetical protein